MDIPSISLAMGQTNAVSDVGTAMLSKSLDSMQTQGDGIAKMMEQSVNPNLGQNIDISV